MTAFTKSQKQQTQISKIVGAMERFDIANSPAWAELDALSSHTYLDGMEIDPDGIIIEGDKFKGSLSVYVLLKYDEHGDDAFETSDAFSGEFFGHFDETGKPVIENATVDTSPFYEH